jgi:endoglucanase
VRTPPSSNLLVRTLPLSLKLPMRALSLALMTLVTTIVQSFGRRVSALPSRLAGALCALALMAPAALAQTLPPAADVARQINVGWNIGNSLEATGGETAWGNPMITQQLIDSVRAAGFNAIRLPVAWDGHANQTTLQIDPVWMARVKEVVDYAIGTGMYVVLNIHWDGGWLEEHPLFSFQTAVNQKQRAYWTQIANQFRTYNERLLFAGTNEVHADFGTPTTEHITVQQSYLQTFVDAVRATGGNNASRTLVVQTYNTNMQHGLNFFTLPVDTISNRLIVETHYYDPFDFTLNPNGSCVAWGAPFPTQGACTWAYESYVTDLFAQVRARWVAQGIPVIIGEYGVATRPNLNLAAREYWLETINRTAASNGIKTFYWDNGVVPSANNGFALFNRSTGAVTDQGAMEAVLRGAGVGNPNIIFTLTTTVNGSGSVSRNPTGTSFPGGTNVTLTATPAAGSEFAGWTGAASGSTNPITIKILSNTTVTANFVPQGTGGSGTILREFWLNVTGSTVSSLTSNSNYPNNPSGSAQLTSLEGPSNSADNYGSRIRGYVHPPISGPYTFWIASDDAGDLLLSTNDNPANATRIAFVDSWTNPREWTKLPSQRSAAINLVAGQKYYIEVLHKEAGGGDGVAVAWQGPGIAQAVIPGSNLSPFVRPPGTNQTLTVTRAGTGTGTVTSSPAGISCGATCSASFASGASVTLTASAASGSTFAGWSGGVCTGTAACTVSMTAARSVTATFNTTATGQTLTVTRAGTGTGTVTSAPSGVNCGTTCSASYANGTSVTLTATAATGSTFAGWSGACTGTGACTVSMSAARAVTATFNTTGTGTPCNNPITFTGNTGNFNTAGAVCYRTSATITGWGCFNFDGRTVTVGGQARTCGQMPLTRSSDGFTYFSVTAGAFPWAGMFIF